MHCYVIRLWIKFDTYCSQQFRHMPILFSALLTNFLNSNDIILGNVCNNEYPVFNIEHLDDHVKQLIKVCFSICTW